MNNTRKYVIAGNYEQYRQWCRENSLGPSQVVYISSEEQLKGLHSIRFEYVGTYWENPVFSSDWLKIAESHK